MMGGRETGNVKLLTSCTILKNRQDACSTKSEFYCGTGILPVHKKLIENGATSQIIDLDFIITLQPETICTILKNRQDACSTKSEFYCGTGILPVHKKLIENGATSQIIYLDFIITLQPETICTILKNRQDACSTKSEFYCGTGILPVHKKLIENGATSQIIDLDFIITLQPETICTILKNRQDACSTKSEFYCGTGILPVHKKLIENGATSQIIDLDFIITLQPETIGLLVRAIENKKGRSK